MNATRTLIKFASWKVDRLLQWVGTHTRSQSVYPYSTHAMPPIEATSTSNPASFADFDGIHFTLSGFLLLGRLPPGINCDLIVDFCQRGWGNERLHCKSVTSCFCVTSALAVWCAAVELDLLNGNRERHSCDGAPFNLQHVTAEHSSEVKQLMSQAEESLCLFHFIVKFTISLRARINFKMQWIQPGRHGKVWIGGIRKRQRERGGWRGNGWYRHPHTWLEWFYLLPYT